jgi:catechol 2,3-dioxygenase-like lactoylglutathione lyase family enzyme
MNSPRFQRSNLIVADLDRALTFYEGVLGFTEVFRKPHNPESYSLTVFDIPEEAEIRFSVLSAPDQPRVLALTEVAGIELLGVPLPRRNALVIECSDPDEVIQGAISLGLKVYPEEILETFDGRIGREIGIVDFDENLVVIYLVPPAE